MRTLLIAILVAAAAWAGWWFWASSARETAVNEWFEDRRADGWVAEGEVEVHGFPNRLDVTITDPELADPEAGWAWTAPFLQLLALSYRTDQVILVWPETQTIATPQGRATIGARSMRASLVTDGDARALERATWVAEGLTMLPEGGETWNAERLTLAVARRDAAEQESEGAAYRFGLDAVGVAPGLRTGVKTLPDDLLPDRLDKLTADLTVTFDRPWSRTSLEEGRPQPRAIELDLAEARWGELELMAAGKLAIDPEGRADGRLTVKARNWRDMLMLARETGLAPTGALDAVEEALAFLSRLSGNRQTLDLPLDFRSGRIFLGPVPVGTAPRLTLR
ncbi:DUF2125 domain-containing protein [Aquicoccus sp. SCR17]|nr:DUF2125 domain-containing protein [Carideicomes alvinocaridis]